MKSTALLWHGRTRVINVVRNLRARFCLYEVYKAGGFYCDRNGLNALWYGTDQKVPIKVVQSTAIMDVYCFTIAAFYVNKYSSTVRGD